MPGKSQETVKQFFKKMAISESTLADKIKELEWQA
jgi:hypothetical protein